MTSLAARCDKYTGTAIIDRSAQYLLYGNHFKKKNIDFRIGIAPMMIYDVIPMIAETTAAKAATSILVIYVSCKFLICTYINTVNIKWKNRNNDAKNTTSLLMPTVSNKDFTNMVPVITIGNTNKSDSIDRSMTIYILRN